MTDDTTGETSPHRQTDLSQWYTALDTVSLQISTTRWFHSLYVQDADGGTYPISPGATQGDASWTADGAAWWNDYGYFNATAQHRAWTGAFTVVDASTGETVQGVTALAAWVCGDTPGAVSANFSGIGAVTVSWTPGATPVTGFSVQRRLGAMDAWQTIGTSDAALNSYTDPGAGFGQLYSYRVIGLHAAGYSLPSVEVALPTLSSNEQWMMRNFGHTDPRPDDHSRPEDDPDGDRFTNAQEQAAGTDPRDPNSKPPSAVSAYYIYTGSPLGFALGASGGNGHVTFALASQPPIGTLSVALPSVYFSCDTLFTEVSFDFTVSQNAYTSPPATITIDYIPVTILSLTAGNSGYYSHSQALDQGIGTYKPLSAQFQGTLHFQSSGDANTGMITFTPPDPSQFTTTLNGQEVTDTVSVDLSDPGSADDDNPLLNLIYGNGSLSASPNSVGITFAPVDPTANPIGTVSASLADHTMTLQLAPVEMMVDNNRDGQMSFTDPTIHDGDQQTSDMPYRFWINDNDDPWQSFPETGGKTSKDSDSPRVTCIADLEDYARIWISLKGLGGLLKDASGRLSLGFKFTPPAGGWNPADPRPSIKLVQAVEDDGGTKYLDIDSSSAPSAAGDTTTANKQLAGKSGAAITDVTNVNATVGTGVFQIPAAFWSAFDDTQPLYLLFEGVTEGRGNLTLVFLDQHGNPICDAGGISIVLKDIENMYERADATPTKIPQPDGTPIPAGTIGFTTTKTLTGADIPADETRQCVIFVHGVNTVLAGRGKPDLLKTQADPLFKRLWWRGFKGRFAALRWDSLMATNGLNYCEYRAWEYGESLNTYVTSLSGQLQTQGHDPGDAPGDQPPYTLNVVAHSMGGVVVSSALTQGMTVDTVAMLQTAVAAGCFDPSVGINGMQNLNAEPDWAPLGYRNSVRSALAGAVQ